MQDIKRKVYYNGKSVFDFEGGDVNEAYDCRSSVQGLRTLHGGMNLSSDLHFDEPIIKIKGARIKWKKIKQQQDD